MFIEMQQGTERMTPAGVKYATCLIIFYKYMMPPASRNLRLLAVINLVIFSSSWLSNLG